jgi:hypothetical protein
MNKELKRMNKFLYWLMLHFPKKYHFGLNLVHKNFYVSYDYNSYDIIQYNLKKQYVEIVNVYKKRHNIFKKILERIK